MHDRNFFDPCGIYAVVTSIIGLLLGVMVVFTTGAMAAPMFTGEPMRDATMLVFMCAPLVQIALVVVGTMREDTSPGAAIGLYALTVALLAVLLAIPALTALMR